MLKKHEINEFLENVAILSAGAKIYSDGAEYVNEVEFWKWFTTDVTKSPVVNGARLPLENSEAIAEWVNSKLQSGKEKYTRISLECRGLEFDFVKEMHDNPLEILKGNIWRRATVTEDKTLGIDAVKSTYFGFGSDETHQFKAGVSDSFSKTDLSQYVTNPSEKTIEHLNKIHKKHTPVDVIDVNDKIFEWRNSDKGVQRIINRGDSHQDVRKSFNVDDIKASGDKRLNDASAGNANPIYEWNDIRNQIGNSVIIGTVVAVSISSLNNFKLMKSGDIDANEFGNRLLKDSVEGGLRAGSFSALNIPVQIAGHALNFGAPVLIPVMIVMNKNIAKILNPAFGKGEYKEILKSLNYTTNISKAIYDFSLLAKDLYYEEEKMLREVLLYESNIEEKERKRRATFNKLHLQLEEI